MRLRHRGLRVSALSLPIAVSLAMGCASMKVPTFEVKEVDAYAIRTEQDGLILAVQPTFEPSEIDRTFRTNLLDKGVLPILLVAENHNPSRAFILQPDAIEIASADTRARASEPRPTVSSSTQGEVMMGAGVLISLPLLIAGIKMVSDSEVIQHNLADKAFYSTTLANGQRARGFLYFRVPKDASPGSRYEVVVDARDAMTGEVVRLNVPFEYRR